MSISSSIFSGQNDPYFNLQANWEPFRDFNWAEGTLTVPHLSFSNETISALLNAKIDWKETSETYIFKIDLPAFKIEQVKVEVEDHRVLRISCEKSINIKEINYKWHQVETKINDKILKRFKLPENVKVDTIKASMDNNGVLTITIPKDKMNK